MQLRIGFDLEPVLLIDKRKEIGEIRLADSILRGCPEWSQLRHFPTLVFVQPGQIDLDNFSALVSIRAPSGITYSPQECRSDEISLAVLDVRLLTDGYFTLDKSFLV